MAISGVKTTSSTDAVSNQYIENNTCNDTIVINGSSDPYHDPATTIISEAGLIYYAGGVLPSNHKQPWSKTGTVTESINEDGDFLVTDSSEVDNINYRIYNIIESVYQDAVIQADIKITSITFSGQYGGPLLSIRDGSKMINMYFLGGSVTEGLYYYDSSSTFNLVYALNWSDGTERTFKLIKNDNTDAEFHVNGSKVGSSISYSNFYNFSTNQISFGTNSGAGQSVIGWNNVKFDRDQTTFRDRKYGDLLFDTDGAITTQGQYDSTGVKYVNGVAVPSTTFTDSFTGTGLDLSKWTPYNYPGDTDKFVDGYINDAFVQNVVGVNDAAWKYDAVTSQNAFHLRGDFDIYIDFDSFANIDENQLQFRLHPVNNNSERFMIIRKYDNQLNSSNTISGETSTTSSMTFTSGKLRYTRIDGEIKTYYDSGSGWVLHYTFTDKTSDDMYVLIMQNRQDNTTSTFTCDVNDFVITSADEVVPAKSDYSLKGNSPVPTTTLTSISEVLTNDYFVDYNYWTSFSISSDNSSQYMSSWRDTNGRLNTSVNNSAGDTMYQVVNDGKILFAASTQFEFQLDSGCSALNTICSHASSYFNTMFGAIYDYDTGSQILAWAYRYVKSVSSYRLYVYDGSWSVLGQSSDTSNAYCGIKISRDGSNDLSVEYRRGTSFGSGTFSSLSLSSTPNSSNRLHVKRLYVGHNRRYTSGTWDFDTIVGDFVINTGTQGKTDHNDATLTPDTKLLAVADSDSVSLLDYTNNEKFRHFELTGTPGSLAGYNGKIVVGKGTNCDIIDLTKDEVGEYSTGSTPAITSNTINDVAIQNVNDMEVVAIANEGNVDLLIDRNTVSSSGTADAYDAICFDSSDNLYFVRDEASTYKLYKVAYPTYMTTAFSIGSSLTIPSPAFKILHYDSNIYIATAAGIYKADDALSATSLFYGISSSGATHEVIGGATAQVDKIEQFTHETNDYLLVSTDAGVTIIKLSDNTQSDYDTSNVGNAEGVAWIG